MRMALTAFALVVTLCDISFALAVPVASSSNPSFQIILSTAKLKPSSLSPFDLSEPQNHSTPWSVPSSAAQAVIPVLLNPPWPSQDHLSPDSTGSPMMLSTEPATVTVTQPPMTDTVPFFFPPATVTRTTTQPATTVTIPLFVPPGTVTNAITVTETLSSVSPPLASSTASSDWPPPPATSSLPDLPGKVTWAAPNQMKDLGSFNVTFFPGGAKNLKIVSGLPAKAVVASALSGISVTNALAGDDELSPLTTWDQSSSALQLLYPANSVNPAQKPQGGAEFYASPLDVSHARNVTLRYSVFFPADFDWVLAGKLPGIYGGHTGCSGGNEALDCFSTRLMWRQGGAGELYLYAAKNKQTKALCADPRSVCDATYGFSIGRGSFTWAAGAWTTVQQTVVLNTPGKQDGSFALDVNGKRIIDQPELFYRDILKGSKTKATPAPTKTSNTKPTATGSSGDDNDPLGDILGPLLGQLSKLIGREYLPTRAIQASSPRSTSFVDVTRTDVVALPTGMPFFSVPPYRERISPLPSPSLLLSMPSSIWHARQEAYILGAETSPSDEGGFSIDSIPQRQGESIGFIGIFFSTFFGGHSNKYATPRDQYVWFKDFAMSYNS